MNWPFKLKWLRLALQQRLFSDWCLLLWGAGSTCYSPQAPPTCAPTATLEYRVTGKSNKKSVNILCLHSIQRVNMSPAYILLLHCTHKLKNEWTLVVWTVSSSAARLQDSSIRDKHVLYFQWRPYFIFVYLFYLFWVSDCVLCCKRAAVVMKRPHGNVWRMVTSAVRSWTWQADCKYTINNALTVDEWIMLSKDFTCKGRCIETCFRF